MSGMTSRVASARDAAVPASPACVVRAIACGRADPRRRRRRGDRWRRSSRGLSGVCSVSMPRTPVAILDVTGPFSRVAARADARPAMRANAGFSETPSRSSARIPPPCAHPGGGDDPSTRGGSRVSTGSARRRAASLEASLASASTPAPVARLSRVFPVGTSLVFRTNALFPGSPALSKLAHTLVVPRLLRPLTHDRWWRLLRHQVQDVHRVPRGRGDELRGQHRREELYVISVKRWGSRLNRLPGANIGEMFMGTVKKGKPDLRKKVFPAIMIRQRKPFRRKDGLVLYFEDNAVSCQPQGGDEDPPSPARWRRSARTSGRVSPPPPTPSCERRFE